MFKFVLIAPIEIMLSKFSLQLLNSTLRFNASPVFRHSKFVINYKPINISGPTRQFQSSKYGVRNFSKDPKRKVDKKAEDLSAQSVGLYSMAIAVLCGGLTFAAVPLYRLFCQVVFVQSVRLWVEILCIFLN